MGALGEYGVIHDEMGRSACLTVGLLYRCDLQTKPALLVGNSFGDRIYPSTFIAGLLLRSQQRCKVAYFLIALCR
jgi:hypothetical protein